MSRWFALAPLLLGLPGAAQIPITSSIAYDAKDSTNAIVLSWEAVPHKHYNVLTTTALGQQPAESGTELGSIQFSEPSPWKEEPPPSTLTHWPDCSEQFSGCVKKR